jgi:hypothetical protein
MVEVMKIVKHLENQLQNPCISAFLISLESIYWLQINQTICVFLTGQKREKGQCNVAEDNVNIAHSTIQSRFQQTIADLVGSVTQSADFCIFAPYIDEMNHSSPRMLDSEAIPRHQSSNLKKSKSQPEWTTSGPYLTS